MKKTSLLVSLFILAATIPARAQSTFPDVPDNHWAAAAVQKLAEAGIIEGRPTSAAAASTRAVQTIEKPATRRAVSAPKSSAAKARIARKAAPQKQIAKTQQQSRASTRSAATRRQGS